MALRVRRQQQRHRWTDIEIEALITIRANTNDRYWYSEYGKYNDFKIKIKYYFIN